MAEQLLTCPNCKSEIPLTDVLTSQIAQELRTEIESEAKEKEKELIEKEKALLKKEGSIEKTISEKLLKERNNLKIELTNEAESKFSLELNDLNEKLKEQQAVNEKLKDAELKARKTERKLQETKEDFDRELEKKVIEAKGKLKKKYDFEKEKEIAEVEINIKNLNEELRKAKNERKDLELEFIKQKDQLEDKKREMEKDFLFNKEKLIKETQDQTQSESRQKLGEKEKTIELLRKEINNLKQTVEQGSQQIQGEVTEEQLKATLKENFYEDIIEDVPVGVNGADIVQTIRLQGRTCGIILWESKNTKLWQDPWIDKLKADQKVVNANFSILVSKTLPKEISNFGDIRNVWVTNMDLVVPLAKILRNAIIELHQKDQTLEGKNLKMEKLYGYLTSPGFKNRISDCLDSFSRMNEELQKEIRTTKNRWAKREEQIKQVEENILSMYGSFEGIVGHSIPQLEDITDNLLEAGDAIEEDLESL